MPAYTAVDEPYHLMEEDGHEFSHPPSIEDFEAQLERSIDELGEAGGEALFDRCPLDFLAYIAVHDDAESFDVQAWLPRIRDALETLDLVVYVPIEERDRVAASMSDDDAEMRTAVDEKLRELLVDDPYSLGMSVVEVSGNLQSRVRAVQQQLRQTSR